ncbi:hypothetical protein E3U55_00110 [Filobacillus milosensis]|uniref:DUF2157 domain-containing protein n=1 Tax=Filobacillus milosensis TaxID=94137 RepID=A0A4Y8ISF1_9BACI|nr:hypothetical protein [Filobacillus milosensis]TFB24830.1 hypothetical protein E3U55_00110 [Filobacillus milosensis]
MGQEKKEIILEEIKYWKTSKLLPSEYCDFLIMLYTQGEGITEQKEHHRKQHGSIWFMLDLIFLLLLIPILFLGLFFYNPSVIVSLLIISGILLIIGGHYYYYKKLNTVYVHLPIILFFLIFLISSIHLLQLITGQDTLIKAIIFLHCFLWLLIGYWKQLYYLVASGIVGVVILVIYYFVI